MSSYYQQIPISQIESQFTITVKEGELSDEIDESEKIKNYIEMIMPLMFETWLEIKPNKAQASVDGENTSFISNENAYMLKVIMDIINQLFDMVKLNDVNREWFLATFYERFASYLLPNFPYCQDDKATKNKTEIVGGEKCVYQNLHICYMFLWFQAKNKQRFSKHKAKVFDFVNGAFLSIKYLISCY